MNKYDQWLQPYLKAAKEARERNYFLYSPAVSDDDYLEVYRHREAMREIAYDRETGIAKYGEI